MCLASQSSQSLTSLPPGCYIHSFTTVHPNRGIEVHVHVHLQRVWTPQGTVCTASESTLKNPANVLLCLVCFFVWESCSYRICYDCRPWTWIGTFQWLWNRDNRQTMITETVRSQQIRSLLKDSYKQEEGDIITYCRSLYVRIKDSYPRHVVPSKVRTPAAMLQFVHIPYNDSDRMYNIASICLTQNTVFVLNYQQSWFSSP